MGIKIRLEMKSLHFSLFGDGEEKNPEIIIKLPSRKKRKGKRVVFTIIFEHRQSQVSMSPQLSLS